MPRRKTEDEVPEVDVDIEEIKRIRSVNDDRVKERIQEYEHDFEAGSLTVIDRAQIRYLARLELASEDATNVLMNTQNLTPAQRKALADSAKGLIAETRQLADTLGMSRKSRMTDEDSEMNEYLPKLHAEALGFLHERGVFIVCSNCLKEQARVEIRQGIIIFNFEFETDWTWRSKCPRCGKKFEINSANYQNFKVSKSPKPVTDVKDEEIEDGDELDGEDED